MCVHVCIYVLILKSYIQNPSLEGLSDRLPHYIGPHRVGSVGSVSASRTVGREFASRPGHTKDHHKNGTNYRPA